MDFVSEVAENIYMIAHHPEDSIYRFQAFFIDGDKPTLIEPGPARFIPNVIEGLGKLGYDASTLSYIIPTHIHADHCGGTGHLAQYAPEAKIIAHEKGARHLVNPEKMMAATKDSWGDDFESEIGEAIPVPEERIVQVKGGETINLGKRSLSVVYSPGHARHHICIFDAEGGELFCGEALGYLLPGEEIMLLPTVSPPVYDVDVVLDTIRRLKELEPSLILFSHYGISHDAARCLDVAAENVKSWGDITLQALQNGENLEQIKGRFSSIVEGYLPGRSPQFSLFMDWAKVGYSGYYIKKGLVKPESEIRDLPAT